MKAVIRDGSAAPPVRHPGAYRSLRAVPGATWLGIAAAAVLFVAMATFTAATLPWKGTADAFAHLDYIYQVHQGHLPEPYGYDYGHRANDTSRQWASAHPPLFYAIASVPMGPDLDAGLWERAVARGRALNIFFGLCTVFALAWAGWVLGGRTRAVLAIALPAIGALLPPFVRFSGEIYNDPLAILLSVLAVTLACTVVKRGVSTTRFAMLAALCALGLATRATFVFALIIALGALLLMPVAQGAYRDLRAWLKALAASAGLACLAVLPIGWFYARNHELSGSWFRSVAKHALQSRTEQSLGDVLANDRFWLLVPEGLLGPKWRSIWPVNDDVSLALFLASVAVVAFLIVTRGHWRNAVKLDRGTLVWLLIAAHFFGLMAAQLQHAVGWGALNFRYFLPALLSIGALLAVAATAWTRCSAFVVTGVSGMMAVSCVLGSMTYLDGRYAAIAKGRGSMERLWTVVERNGIPEALIWAALAAAACALVVLAVAVDRAGRLPHPPIRNAWTDEHAAA